jgi:hypothetical protein
MVGARARAGVGAVVGVGAGVGGKGRDGGKSEGKGWVCIPHSKHILSLSPARL